jgi:HSP20 family molecular chaperone IbpA
MAEKTVATRSPGESQKTGEDTRSQQRYFTPPVDIYETPEALVVLADVPGVSKENLDVRVDKNLLTIHGTVSNGVHGDFIYREYELANYFRQFELTNHVDQSRISAELRHGVLTLSLPKAEEAKPKKIEVSVS